MYLKSMTLKGFKSFAEKTVLDLEPGVTVVVGPNGSGKSNLVDAMAWVLGAQGPSTVRSGKMDDVVFAGTSKLAALGRAEVELVIDNDDGVLPVDFSEVTVRRTLFRSGDSEYAINGVNCRLLDVQELLSDSGIGRSQHVIVSQGQLDDVLKSRATDRRLIIEEAAGVLKYRKRKEKAERRLAATEANLLRLQDLLREIRRGLRPLERQADAARRHGSLVDELSGIRLFLTGREIESARAKLTAADANLAQMAGEEKAVRGRLGELDTDVLATEARLSGTGADDVGDALVRYEAVREKAKGIVALLAERRRGIERDRGAFLDQAVLATLEAEATRLRTELAEVEAEATALVPAARKLEEAKEVLTSSRASFDQRWGGTEPASGGQAAEVRGELTALRTAVAQGTQEEERLASRLGALDQKVARLSAEVERLRGEMAAADEAEAPLLEEVDAAEARRSAAAAAVEAAEVALRASEGDRDRWRSRAEALGLALDDARAAAGAERLAGIDGVRGTLLDLVAVDDGFEAAFESALGEALSAVVVDGTDVARRSLERLRGGDGAGAVLALGLSRRGADGPPPVGSWLRGRVRPGSPSDHGVDSLLDGLLRGCVLVDGGWAEALDAAIAHPDLVVVTRDGDRFAGGGWRVGLRGSGATGAALEEALDRTEAAEAEVGGCHRVLREVRDAQRLAREAEAEVASRLDANDSRLAAASDGLQRMESELRDANTEAATLRRHHDELAERLGHEQARVDELATALTTLEAEEAEVAEQIRARRAAEADLEEKARAVGVLRSDVEVRASSVEERRIYLKTRLEEVDARLAKHDADREAVEKRRVELEQSFLAVDRLATVARHQLEVVDDRLGGLRDRRRRQSEATRAVADQLDTLRRERAARERELEEVRERARRIELDRAEVKVRLEGLEEAARHELDCEPDVAIAAECPELPEGTSARARARELERELKIMGPINPLALQEFDELKERHDFTQSQLDDVKNTRRELVKVIRAVDAEIVEVFRGAYADVAENFTRLFDTLFPGGKGRLTLTEPDNLLETGIEIEARPAGKNVKKLSLLSGGERSLTAMAFLFAVFRSRPSPFYVLDEVEAALDDINLHRFLDLVNEFRQEAQLLIVSHQKRTMEAADCLYGVTMQEGGSSRVVSEKLAS